MKRVVLIIIAFYLLLAIAFFIFKPSVSSYNTILTINQEVSEVVFKDERITYGLYTSDIDSYLFDNDLITQIYIKSNEALYLVSGFFNISDTDTFRFHDEAFHKITISLYFEEIWINNASLHFPNATVEIHYLNDQILSFPIGNLSLYLIESFESHLIDFYSLYGLSSSVLDNPFLGIVIEIDRLYENQIQLLNFSLNGIDYRIDNEGILIVNNIRYNTIEEASDEMLFAINLVNNEYELNSIATFLLPIITDSEMMMSRCPLFITYRYHHQVFTFIIDDFVYYQTIWSNLEEIEDVIKITRHYN